MIIGIENLKEKDIQNYIFRPESESPVEYHYYNEAIRLLKSWVKHRHNGQTG